MDRALTPAERAELDRLQALVNAGQATDDELARMKLLKRRYIAAANANT